MAVRDKHGKSYLCEFEWHLEGEGFVVVGVQGAFLDGRLLLAQALPVLHERDLYVGICKQAGKEGDVISFGAISSTVACEC